MIFLAKGTYTCGTRCVDGDGNTKREEPAKFVTDPNGGSVAVGVLDDDTMEQVGQAELFGDFDPWGYLGQALKLLAPTRAGNIPDFEKIVKGMYHESPGDGCPFSVFCESVNCRGCIVYQWMEEMNEE